MLAELVHWLTARDDVGLVIMYGTHDGYARSHRELPLDSRRIVEDAWLQGSHGSRFVQVADLVVHAALQSVVRPAGQLMKGLVPEAFPADDLVLKDKSPTG